MLKPAVSIVVITTDTFPAWRELRLRALHDHPDFFGQPHAEFAALSFAEARDRFLAWRDEGTVILGAVDNDDLVGIVRISREDGAYDSHRMGLYGMYVIPEARGTGVADALVTAAIAAARATAGVLQIHLSLASHNVAARRLYERHGFIRYGVEPRTLIVDGNPHNEDLMALMLDGFSPEAHSGNRSGKADVPVTIAEITAESFPTWREMRLRALHDHPDAFGQPHASYAAITFRDALARFEARRETGTVILGAFGDLGQLLGSLGVFRESGSRTAHRLIVWGMYVVPDVRGTGVADALVSAGLDKARVTDGIRQVHLTVTSHNIAARKLYERHGFVRWGTDPRAEIFDGVAFDQDHMVLILDDYPMTDQP